MFSEARRIERIQAMKQILIIFAFILCVKAHAKYEGTYRSISESEWEITLVLKKGGTGELIVTNWSPGKYSERAEKKTPLNWKLNKDLITLSYSERTDKYEYTDSLVFEESNGQKGPGLKAIKPIQENSILNGHPLWKTPIIFLKK
jgi:hypothetical protein